MDTTTVIGPNAKKPLILDNPVYISHMSFGALSKEAKISLARGRPLRIRLCAVAKAGFCRRKGSGGQIYFEYVPNLYSVTPENLRRADAIEIKIGQGTKPGMGGHLPGGKVTRKSQPSVISSLGQDVISPSRFLESIPERICGRWLTNCAVNRTAGRSGSRSQREELNGSGILCLCRSGFYYYRRKRRRNRGQPASGA